MDTVLSSLRDRFNTDEIDLLHRIEEFVIKSESDSDDSGSSAAEKIVQFYGSDFDSTRLSLHRDIFIDFFVRTNGRKPSSLQEAIDFFLKEESKPSWILVPELR